MKIDKETVRALDRTMAALNLPEKRSDEITLELNQLANAIERVAGRVDFDTDPHDFQVALRETSKGPVQ